MARGGRLDVRVPWALYPVALAESQARLWLGEGNPKDGSQRWLERWRSVYKDVLLRVSKEHLRVLSDPFGPLGTSGLMGNVKEWCHDAIGNNGDERAILGATGYLGEASFAFDYGTSLFPRNTNPDVGFRVCRSVTDDEKELLRARERQLGKLSSKQNVANLLF